MADTQAGRDNQGRFTDNSSTASEAGSKGGQRSEGGANSQTGGQSSNNQANR